jgi:hypothetical protein
MRYIPRVRDLIEVWNALVNEELTLTRREFLAVRQRAISGLRATPYQLCFNSAHAQALPP